MYDLKRGVIARIMLVALFFIGSFAITDLVSQMNSPAQDASDAVFTTTRTPTNAITGHAVYGVQDIGDEQLSNWNKTLYPGSGTSSHAVFSMLNDSSNNILMIGAVINGTRPYVNETASDWRIVKFDSDGNVVAGWNITYTANHTHPQDDIAYDAALDSTGNLYVVGSASYSGLTTFHAKKYSSAGTENPLWNKTLTSDDSGDTSGYGIDIDSNDNIYLIGSNRGGGFNFFTFLKFHSNGTKQWEINLSNTSGSRYNNLGPPSTDPRSIDVVVNDSGHSFVSFFDDDFSNGGWLVHAYAPNSSLLWEYYHHNPSSMPVKMMLDANDLYVVGSYYDSSSFTESWLIKKLNTHDGAENITHWNITYSDPDGSVYASSITPGEQGSIYVVGSIQNLTSGNKKLTGQDWRITRYEQDATFNQTWNLNYTSGENGSIGIGDVPYTVLNIPSDALYVGGYMQEPIGAFSYQTKWWVKKINNTDNPIVAQTTCSSVQNSINLTQNLSSSQTCFTINQSNLVIDGSGYSITGSTNASAILAIGKTNVTIKNLRISNFTNAVDFLNSTGNIINVTFLSVPASPQNSYGLIVNNSNVTVLNSTFNATGGIATPLFIDSQNFTMQGSSLYSYNDGVVVRIAAGKNLLFENNSFHIDGSTASTGIRTFDQLITNLTITHNTIRGSNSHNAFGLILNLTQNTTLAHNYIRSTGNSGAPLTLDNAQDTTIRNNTFFSVQNAGTAISIGSNVTFTNNSVWSDNAAGVRGVSFVTLTQNRINVSDSNGILTTGEHNIIKNNIVSTQGDSRSDATLKINTVQTANITVINNTLTNTGPNSAVINIDAPNFVFNDNFINASGSDTYGLYFVSNANNVAAINNTVYTTDSYSVRDFSGGNNNSLTYKTSHGIINWTLSSINIEENLTINGTILLQDNLLGVVDSPNMGSLNSSATLTFFGLSSAQTPYLLKNGVRCDTTDDCNISSYAANTLVANVSSFSNYTTQAVSGSSSSSSSSSSSGGGSGGGGGGGSGVFVPCDEGYDRIGGKCTKVEENKSQEVAPPITEESDQESSEQPIQEQIVEQTLEQDAASSQDEPEKQEAKKNLFGNAALISIENFADKFREWILIIALLIVVGGLSIVLTISVRHHMHEKPHKKLSALTDKDIELLEQPRSEQSQVPVHMLRESQLDKPVPKGYSRYDSQLAEIDRKLQELDGPSDGHRVLEKLPGDKENDL